MNIRIMTIDDYESVYNLWLNTPNMGLNNIDDSKEMLCQGDNVLRLRMSFVAPIILCNI